jgi:uncharacterized protein (TIGR03067 family)
MKPIAIPLALLAVSLTALAADPSPSEKDAKAIQGTWQAQTQRRGDDVEEEARTRQHRLVFDGDKFKILRDEQVMVAGTFTLDAAAKPATIDMKVTEAGGDQDAVGKTVLGLYELSGDDLKWCSARPGATDRPKSFDTSGTRDMLVTFKRAGK